jgi:UDP-N-acetylbacillosamine N-acetyltransferase
MRTLLILGAGGHGKVVSEIAEDIGYDKIEFLDDNNLTTIGKISELEKFGNQYDEVFVGVGNNELRAEMIQKLEDCGYTVPVLIHPSAYVSRSATVGKGAVVEPNAIINANSTIGVGSIISVGAIVEHNAEVGAYCHINSGAIVKAGGKTAAKSRIDAGQIVEGY